MHHPPHRPLLLLPPVIMLHERPYRLQGEKPDDDDADDGMVHIDLLARVDGDVDAEAEAREGEGVGEDLGGGVDPDGVGGAEEADEDGAGGEEDDEGDAHEDAVCHHGGFPHGRGFLAGFVHFATLFLG